MSLNSSSVELRRIDEALAARPHPHRGDLVARLALVVERDHRGVVLDDRRRRIERGLHHLLGRERAAEHRGRLVEPLVLVLRALDGAEHLLGLHDAQHLRARVGEQIAIGLGERRVAIGGEDAAQVAALDDRHRDERDAGAAAVVVRQLAGLGRGDEQRLAIAQHRAEHARASAAAASR